MFLCPKCAIPLQCKQCEAASYSRKKMGRGDTCSGGVITYPQSPPLLPQGRDYANVNNAVNSVVGPTSQSVVHRSSFEGDRVGSSVVSSPPSCADAMISVPISPQCMFKQQQQLEQQFEEQRRQLDRQHYLLQFKLLEIYRQKCNELNPLLQQNNVNNPFSTAFQPLSVPSPTFFPTAVPPPTAAAPQSTTSALFITATSSPFHSTPTVEVSAPILLSNHSTPDPVRDSMLLEATRSQLEQCGWYHGSLSWQESNLLLERTAHGTFLLRDSQYPGCLYSLSINQVEHGPTSIRIHFSNGRFRLDSDAAVRSQMPAFSSVIELVEYYLKPVATRNSAANDPTSAKNQVSLKSPLYKSTPSLAHLARLSINRSLASGGKKADVSKLELPNKMLQYLNSYKSVV